MPVRHDPILAHAIAREIGDRRSRKRLRALVLDRDRRAAALVFRGAPCLLFLLHPEDGQILEGGRRPPAVLDGPRLELRGLFAAGVQAPADERLLVLDLLPGGRKGTPHRLVAELHTNQWNLLLLRRAKGEPGGGRDATGGDRTSPWIARAVLWPREPGDRVLRAGAPYRPPAGGRDWTDRAPTPREWRERLGGVEPERRRSVLLRSAAWTSSINAAWILAPVGRPEEPGDADPLAEARDRYLELREIVRPGADAPDAFVLDRPAGAQPYPHPLDGPGATAVPSLLAGMRASTRRGGRWGALFQGPGEDSTPASVRSEEARALEEALRARRDRLERRVAALRRELEESEDPEAMRSAGHLILARLDEIPRGREQVELEGFEGEPRRLELDPALSPAENAERYYEEAARRERARERIPVEIDRARRLMAEIDRAREELPREEVPEELWRLAGGRPDPGADEGGGGAEEQLPYVRYFSSGGLEIRAGRSARGNEALTFHHSHTEDVWLHARQVPGAHVILRWGRKDENPPRRDLLEAAVIAAVRSDARHSATVGVDWTRRKYVRSPRKSAPGVVIPRNVRTLFVEPDEKLVERLRAE